MKDKIIYRMKEYKDYKRSSIKSRRNLKSLEIIRGVQNSKEFLNWYKEWSRKNKIIEIARTDNISWKCKEKRNRKIKISKFQVIKIIKRIFYKQKPID